MNTQPEALRLADALEAYEFDVVEHGQQAAAELRRLQAERDELKRHLAYWLPDETMIPEGHQAAWGLAASAIAKAEGKE